MYAVVGGDIGADVSVWGGLHITKNIYKYVYRQTRTPTRRTEQSSLHRSRTRTLCCGT